MINMEDIRKQLQAGNKIIIGLKLPTGLFFDVKDHDGKMTKVEIYGYASDLKDSGTSIMPSTGVGLTIIDKLTWNEIYKTYHNLDIFKQSLIFAIDKEDDIVTKRRELEKIKSKYEPISIELLGAQR